MNILQSDQELVLSGFDTEDGVVFACNGAGLKGLLWAGKRWLEAHIDVVNGLNVFPVPDGDTGTNMVLTMQSALTAMNQATDRTVDGIIKAAAYGALMGARGNSGVILAEFLQGLSLGLQGKEVFTAPDFAQAAELGVERAYASVVHPVEGTILTVAKAAAQAATVGVQSNQDLTAILGQMVEASKIAQANTPNLLPVLKEAGVTDSGGQGLLYILEGAFRFINHEPINAEAVHDTVPVLQSTLGVAETTYGYDVQFLIYGDYLNVATIRTYIDSIGQSTVVVGDNRMVKVHVHVDDPGVPLSYGASLGTLSDVVVENMTQQAKAFVQNKAFWQNKALWQDKTFGQDKAFAVPAVQLVNESIDIGTVVVAPGPGFIEIFESLGVNRVIMGGQTMNPSTKELLAVVNQLQAEHVLILPNNGNIILTAQQVKKLAKKQVEIIPTKTVPQGIGALIAFNTHVDLKTNLQRMLIGAEEVRTLEITRAARQTVINGIEAKSGDIIGFFDDELVAVGQDYNTVVLDILHQIEVLEYEILTIYLGQAELAVDAENLVSSIKRLYPDIELEIYNGGQPYYYYIISLE